MTRRRRVAVLGLVARLGQKRLARVFATWIARVQAERLVDRTGLVRAANTRTALSLVSTLIRTRHDRMKRTAFRRIRNCGASRRVSGGLVKKALDQWYRGRLAKAFASWRELYFVWKQVHALSTPQVRVVKALRGQLARAQEAVLQLRTEKTELERRLHYADRAAVQARLQRDLGLPAPRPPPVNVVADGLNSYRKALRDRERTIEGLQHALRGAELRAAAETKETLEELRAQRAVSDRAVERHDEARRRMAAELDAIKQDLGGFFKAFDAERRRRRIYSSPGVGE